MPWGADDAPGFSRRARTPKLRRLWAKVANSELMHHGDEGRAVRAANAAVHAVAPAPPKKPPVRIKRT